MNQKHVVILGDAMLDVVVRALEPVHLTSDTSSKVLLSRGGSAANIGVEVALNHHVAFVGVVGDDSAGEVFTRDLRDADVTPLVHVLPGSTGVVVAFVNDKGQRAMLTDRGVNPRLTSEVVRSGLQSHFDHLHVSGYTVLDQRTRKLAPEALWIAHEHGASTSVDVCSVGPLRQVGAKKFLKAIGPVSMLFANQEEAKELSGESDVRNALKFLQERSKEVVITLGKGGAIASCEGEVVRKPSRNVEVVDTTGAGDAATGVYLSRRLSGRSCNQSLELAMSRAAQVVRRMGSRP